MTAIAAAHWNPSDHLNRRAIADKLTEIIINLPEKDEAWVCNLDGRYGSGKSFLIDRWQIDLASTHCVLHFDAWEFDYLGDPFTTFAAEIIDQLQNYEDKSYQAVLKDTLIDLAKTLKAAWIFADIFVDKSAMKHFVDLPEYDDANKAAKEVNNLLRDFQKPDAEKKKEKILSSEPLSQHRSLRQSLAAFHCLLQQAARLVREKSGKPLIIFVDELDRCKPLFAVGLLERIKHVFNCKDIVFIVVTHREAFSHAVKALYGQTFDAADYLERFFDIHLQLPLFSPEQFILQRTINLVVPPIFAGQPYTGTAKEVTMAAYAAFFRLNLRQIEKAISLTSILMPIIIKPTYSPKSQYFLFYAVLFISCWHNCTAHKGSSAIIKVGQWKEFLGKWEAISQQDNILVWNHMGSDAQTIVKRFAEIFFMDFDTFNFGAYYSKIPNTHPMHQHLQDCGRGLQELQAMSPPPFKQRNISLYLVDQLLTFGV